ncbi:MAG: alpha/beta hydrolase [Hyphomicrobiales bacterium]|nr:alpha/beta hydrolase [Hyphomicrobiales bacterium]MBV8825034.1 alpha/beta hydrolase [Hyphomicrobiales bacterium]MBV9429865.1 alpha/beta hydrolase [Bradyrhizobiaceae bacterium]
MNDKVFLDYDQAALDRQYNQRAWVANADELIRRYAEQSDAVRARVGEPESIAYGPAPTETFDLYRAARAAAPLLIFAHGGAWQRLSKRESAFAAEAFVRAGAHFAALDFASVPAVSLADLVDQVRGAVAFAYRNAERLGVVRERIHLAGHSSGAHLAACALTTDWAALGLPQIIKSGMCVSGIYDLRPVRLSARNEYLRLDEAAEDSLSPQRHVNRLGCPLIVAAVDLDPPEFRRQARDFAAAAARAGATVRHVEGREFNHFDFIETLADPQGLLGKLMLEQMDL